MNKYPKFSIIVPAYNVEKYLSYCMESIIKQSLQDIEIICVNDGSTDNTLAILEQYARLDKRIKIIDQLNSGSSIARNIGLENASGEYIMFVDSDDLLVSNACERVYMETLQAQADIVVFGAYIFPCIQENDNGWLYEYLGTQLRDYKQDSINAFFKERASKPFIWNKCYRRALIEDNNIYFDKDLSLGEDSLFLFTLFPLAERIIYIPDQLYRYRCERKGSLMDIGRQDIESKLYDHLELIRKVISLWEKNGYTKGYENEVYYWCIDLIVNEINNPILSKSVRQKIVKTFSDIINTSCLRNIKLDKKTKKEKRKLL